MTRTYDLICVSDQNEIPLIPYTHMWCIESIVPPYMECGGQLTATYSVPQEGFEPPTN
jgi:hypothetical protein